MKLPVNHRWPFFSYSAVWDRTTDWCRPTGAFAVGSARPLKEDTRLEIAVEGVGCGRRVGGILQKCTFDQVGDPGIEQHGVRDDPIPQASLDLLAGEVAGSAGTVPYP